MTHKLIDFWQNVNFQPNTYIAQDDFDVLKANNLLVSKQKYIQNSTNNNVQTLLHDNLPAEPFVGDLLNSKVYIITLNPGVGDDEYDNWQDVGLNAALKENLEQQKTDYPFYYLNPSLSHTGGAKYWGMPNGKFAKIIKELSQVTGNIDAANRLVAQNVCDLEFCPYHSKKWGIKPELIRSLPSVKKLIDFLSDYVIPDVIAGRKSLIVGRKANEISRIMSEKRFDYKGQKITFDDLDILFPDNVVFYRTPGMAISMSFAPNKPAGHILINQLKKCVNFLHSSHSCWGAIGTIFPPQPMINLARFIGSYVI